MKPLRESRLIPQAEIVLQKRSDRIGKTGPAKLILWGRFSYVSPAWFQQIRHAPQAGAQCGEVMQHGGGRMPKTPRAIREPLDAGSKSEPLPDSPPRRPVIPLAGFPAGNLRRGMLEAKNAPRFDPRQREGTLPHQRGLKSPGNVLTHHAASFRPSSLQASSPSASGVSLIIRPVSSRRLPGGSTFSVLLPRR